MSARLACGAAIALVACGGATSTPLAPLPTGFRPPAVKATPSTAASNGSRPSHAPVTSPPETAASLPAVSQGDIGGQGALEVVTASNSGAWVALCQGSPRSLSLVLGSGTGEPIDDLLAQDPSGRYLVVRQNAATLLIDALSGTRSELAGADVRRARSDYATHRSLSFSADGQLFAYLREQNQQSHVVVRKLLDGSEQAYAAGAGSIFRLRLSADARFVALEALREDTSHNGKLDWPTPEESASKRPCSSSPLPKFRSFTYQGRGDALTRAVLSTADGSLRDVPELVTPLGQQLVVREADASLRLDQNGKRSPLASASCAARVLFADAERGLVLASCALPKKPGKRAIWLLGSGYAKDLQSELYETSTDREAVTGVRLVPLYPGSDAALVDLERRELLPLAPGSRVVSVAGELALLWRGSELYRYDAGSKTEVRLAQGVLKNPDLLQTGPVVLLSPFVIVDGFASALKSPSPWPLALSATGHVLAGSDPAANGAATDAIQGPLHWLDARLPAPDGRPH